MQRTAYEMRISDGRSDVCSAGLQGYRQRVRAAAAVVRADGRNADGVETRREDLVGIAAGEYRDLVIARQGRQYRHRPHRVTAAVAHHAIGNPHASSGFSFIAAQASRAL